MMPRFLRQFLSIFIFSRQKRKCFRAGWGRCRNRGKNNRIILVEENGERSVFAAPHTVPGVDLMFEGDGNTLCLHKPFYFDRCEWLLSDGSYVEIQSSRYEMKKSTFSILNGGRVLIGKDFSSNDGLDITGFDEPGLTLQIGDDCMFSYGILIRLSDGHALYSLADGRLLNEGKGVRIGTHVWAGQKCSFLKGAGIPDNCVVGACSMVTKKFDEQNSVYAGIPARRVNKEPIGWTRTSIQYYQPQNEK